MTGGQTVGRSSQAATHVEESVSPAHADLTGRDNWLDEVAGSDRSEEGSSRRAAWKSVLGEALTGPLGRLRTIYSFLATTPGKMVGITVLLSVAIFAAGYSMSESAAQRQNGLDTLLSETEPLSFAAHNLYTNLSLADTIATSGFVRSGSESEESLDRYYTAIDRAAIAATQTASGIDPERPNIGELITEIQRDLPVYTAMVETARTNARAGNPVGVTYMSNASALMRTDILPNASELFRITSADVAAQQQELTTPQWVPLSGLFAAVFFLVLTQWWLWRATGRRLNRGFLAATVFMVLAILWVSLSNFMTWQAGIRGFEEASKPWDSLTNSRILAQQAQTSETLALVRRESADETHESFNAMTWGVSNALDDMEAAINTSGDSGWGRLGGPRINAPASAEDTVLDARRALAAWHDTHGSFEEALNTGDYDEAARLTSTVDLPPGATPTAASSATSLDDALSTLIDDARTAMRAFIAEGLAATVAVATAVLLLAFAAVLSVWLGIRARLQEYL